MFGAFCAGVPTAHAQALSAAASAAASPSAPADSTSEPLTDLSIEQLLNIPVQTATLKKQSLRDAPADVSVITAADIRRYGYRTLGEALSNVRGFYTTFDGGFQFSGVRGFNLPGDYNTRFLVMINGHHMTDNVYSAMYMFGQDFGLDMGLIEQIEIVRGPSSALYGSNGLFATVNIITKAPGRQPATRVSVEGGSFGESKLIASQTFQFGRTGRGVVSASGFHSFGRSASVAPLDDPGSPVPVDGIGMEQGFHTFANLAWGQWNLTALFGERRINVPTAFYNSDLGDTGTRSLEGRNFIELAWRKPIGQSQALKWRFYYDQFRYDGVYKFLRQNSYVNDDGAAGDWLGSQFLYERQSSLLGTSTFGADTNLDIRNHQYSLNRYQDGSGQELWLDFRRNNYTAGVFFQQEWSPSPAWTFYGGVRYDNSRNNPGLFSPRAAVVFKPRDTAYKFTWSRAFRNPSTYERYYYPTPTLQAERLHSYELTRDQQIASRLHWIATVFHYRLSGLIQGIPVDDFDLQYRNASKATATGFETELSGRPFDWLETNVGYTRHRVRGQNSQTLLANSPAHLLHFRAAVPLAGERFTASGAVRYVSSRMAPFGGLVGSNTLLDLTLTGRFPSRHLDLQMGVRNLADQQVYDPLSEEHGIAQFPRPGRSFFVKITWGAE